MKTSQILAAFGFTTLAMAQSESLAPSPTESFGCEPHIDHWHCEGARPTAAITSTVMIASSFLSTPSASATVTKDHDHDDDDHDHDHSGTGSYTLAPSPTESFGCEAHIDHWHCEGPVTAASGSPTTAVEATLTSSPTTNGAATTASGEGAAATSTALPAGAARAGFGAAAVAAVAALVVF
ncbi:uncharacterized protein LY79DRAFT_523070 [Colletotrichum navitas]|uniref:GPI anchored protein n=1 Tax=Colletotrichum navitas TaxID=681940 RepID=A0AAD8PRB9_9PEZI|nr:uncharacterized protein LY79DRAFT_523070 [Colletotrichum navitas]KAK1579206.1 hypothetical protein LY79DRAFT_523070 [Colletotrichum navitas]